LRNSRHQEVLVVDLVINRFCGLFLVVHFQEINNKYQSFVALDAWWRALASIG
jgi:hypothetical protein